VILSRRLRRGGKLWIRVFPDKPFTKKPAESRMGKGKGEVEGWVAVIKKGQILFELGGVPEDYARESFRLVAYKLPFKTIFVTRR
jgi:large subunit ribosomal protein L16